MSREEEQIAYKYLKLVNPPVAENGYGIKAEAPVFVSPSVYPDDCKICGIHYTALVYQVGYETRAQHFHEQSGIHKELRGGIYTKASDGVSPGQFWLATVGLIGKYDYWLRRSEAVDTHSVKAFCAQHGEELNEGLVVLTSVDTLEGYNMRPICYESITHIEKYYGCLDKWNFQVTPEGSILFRPV